MPPINIASETVEYHDPSAAMAAIQAQMASDANHKLLAGEAQNRGYVASTKLEDHASFSHSFTAAKPVTPLASLKLVGDAAAPVQNVTFNFNVQSFSKPRSQDKAGI